MYKDLNLSVMIYIYSKMFLQFFSPFFSSKVSIKIDIIVNEIKKETSNSLAVSSVTLQIHDAW